MGVPTQHVRGALDGHLWGELVALRVRIAQPMNDRREGDVLGRMAGSSSLSATLPEHLVLVVYVSSRWRPVQIAYESSAAPRVRVASRSLAVVVISQSDLVDRETMGAAHGLLLQIIAM